MKADESSSDKTERGQEATVIRNDEATLPANSSVIYTGDFNSSPPEQEFTVLTGSGQGQAFDPENFSTSTQWWSESTDDLLYRDDYEMMTSNVLNDTGPLDYVANSFQVFGNNGTTPSGGETNASGNTALGDLSNRTAVLNDLMQPYGSDHMPIVADYGVGVSLANLTWDNAGTTLSNDGMTWDVNNFFNWNNGSNASTFVNGNAVTFNDTNNTHYTVTLNTTVSPGSVTVNNSSGNYSISGTGTIAGTGSLTKSGTATLTLSTANTYTGGTNINGGVLNVGSSGALGTTGVVSFGGGTLQYSSSNTTDYSSRFSSAVNQAFRVDTNGRNVTWATALTSSGGSLAKLGAGTLTLNAQETYSGATTIGGGTLLVGAANYLSPNSSVNVSGGTLDVSAAPEQIAGLTVGASGTLNLGIAGGLLTDTGTASFGGTLNISGSPSGSPVELMSYTSDSGTFASVPTFAGYNLVYGSNELELVLAGPANITWTNAGSTYLWDTTTSSNWNNGTGAAVFNSQDNVTFDDNNPSNTSANYSVTLNTTVSPGSVTVNNSLGNYSISGTGTIGGTGSLTKSGSGTLTLSTANAYSGGTIVTAGKVLIEPTSPTTSALPTGALSISGNGIVQLADNVSAGTPLGTSNVNLTSLSLTGNGTLDIGNNRVIIDYSSPATDPIASIAAWIENGFYDLAGPQIISSDIAADDAASGLSYGIGYADGADGLVAGLPSGEIEIMFTLLGDANLDGTVNSEDFTPFSANVGKNGSWDDGDFNYDGTVNSEDFTPFSADLGKSATLAAAAGTLESAGGISLANVPEPASMGLLTLGLASALVRRRRRVEP